MSTWLSIDGYDGLYEVSDEGQVRTKGPRGGLLKQATGSGNYLSVSLGRPGKRARVRVHVLVATAFLGARPKGALVRHLDGNPRNNASANLAWGTPSENLRDAVAHGTHFQAQKTHCPRGHEYTPENVYINTNGSRMCRECRGLNGSGGAAAMWRARTHCPQGHPYDEANTCISGGRRHCRACNRDRQRAYRARRKG